MPIYTGCLELRSTGNKALTMVQGISTCTVDDLIQAMGVGCVYKSQVSRLCAEIGERIGDILSCPIGSDWPYLWLDTIHGKARETWRIVPVAVVIAVGVNGDRRREVLGTAVGASEAETFWLDFQRSLTRCGLRGVAQAFS